MSSDCQFSEAHNFFETLVNVTINDIKIMSYVACIYDAKWWVGLVEEVDKCNNDILVNFMHPFGPSKTFIWSQPEYKCYVQGDSAKCAQILFLVLCTCISSIINFQLLTFQFLII